MLYFLIFIVILCLEVLQFVDYCKIRDNGLPGITWRVGTQVWMSVTQLMSNLGVVGRCLRSGLCVF